MEINYLEIVTELKEIEEKLLNIYKKSKENNDLTLAVIIHFQNVSEMIKIIERIHEKEISHQKLINEVRYYSENNPE